MCGQFLLHLLSMKLLVLQFKNHFYKTNVVITDTSERVYQETVIIAIKSNKQLES